MNYFQKKKLAFMSIVNSVKGFIRAVTGALPLTLEGCVDEESIIDYTLYGQSVQNGTPTPETPVEVESVGEYDETTGKYKIPIKVSGKNLFDISSVNKMYNSSGGDISNHLIIEDGVLRNKYGAYADNIYIPCNITTLSAGTYTLSCEVSGATDGYVGMHINKVGRRKTFKNPNGVDWEKISYKFTLEEESTITGIQLQGFGNASNYLQLEIYFRNIQIEESDTATDYEPYHEPITTNIYLDKPLRKLGNYVDYIDFENGKVIRNVKETRLNNTTFIYTWIGKKGVTFDAALDNNYDRIKGLCNRNKIWTANGYETYTMWLGASSRVIYWIGILDYLGLTTVTEMNEWLTNNPTYVFYGTDIPTETPIPLPNLPTFKGTSIISADTTVQPSNAEITYYSNVKE